MRRIIFETEDKVYRIIETEDDDFDIEDLKGDCYNPDVNPDEDPKILSLQEERFERRVYEKGVYGYTLEKWNPSPECGYEVVDSCFGFVGKYDPTNQDYNHCIVDEMRETINTAYVAYAI